MYLIPIALVCLSCLVYGRGFVDAKINTLESEGKCSPSHGKSTKRASQFDLKLTKEKKSQIREHIGWDSEYLSDGRIGKLC